MKPQPDRHTYVSPFPRQLSNVNVLRLSRPLTSNESKSDVIYFEIPPTITKTYMNRNAFYFDLKSVKNKTTTNQFFKSADSKTFKKVIQKVNDSSYRNNLTNYTHCIVDKKKIENLLNGDQNLLIPKPVLSPKKDSFKVKQKLNNRVKCDENLNMSTKLINNMLHAKPKYPLKHKKFGNVPEYINEFRIRQTIEKEYERLLEEEKNYPKGTLKVSELERVNILNKLYTTRENLLKELSLFPVSSHVRSIKIQNQKASIENRLEEVDYAIKTFERSQIFLKNNK